jgi:predicted hydrocarbon binding protein
LSEFKSVAAAAQVAMKVATLDSKIKLGLEFFSKFFNAVSDQVVKIGEEEERFLWIIERCPVCWGRKTDEPCCHLAVGILQAAAGWVSEGKRFRIKEIECVATGGKKCVIALEKEPLD